MSPLLTIRFVKDKYEINSILFLSWVKFPISPQDLQDWFNCMMFLVLRSEPCLYLPPYCSHSPLLSCSENIIFPFYLTFFSLTIFKFQVNPGNFEFHKFSLVQKYHKWKYHTNVRMYHSIIRTQRSFIWNL